MGLPTIGQITLKQINAEFGGSNTLKSNATLANISTSNVGCKSFYGLTSAIDPVYIQEVPTTSLTGWIADNITGGYVQEFTSVEPQKIPLGNASATVTREFTCTPGVTYTVSCRTDHGGIANGCIHRVYDKASYDNATPEAPAIICGSSASFTDSTNKFVSFTFVAVNPLNYVRFSVTGDPIESSFNSTDTAYAWSRVKEVRIEL
jgi:hypothetical protein